MILEDDSMSIPYTPSETKRKIKIIAEKEGQSGAARVTSTINQRMYHWSKKQMRVRIYTLLIT